jgi:serine/threonine protein kinase
MGTVYAGEHVEIGKGVAVKILHPAYSRQQDLVERFRREARAASRVGHPNIIDVTDFGTTEDGCAYFVMEHLDGIDLADVLSHERRIEPARACQITVQICHALQAAHATGVIHRDLKPENIFLVARDGKADFVKVLDFGIASSLTPGSRRLTHPGVTVGTPEYMAPEQASGGVVDRRSDIYSVGALLYEMVTGAPPHAGAADVLASRVSDPPRAPVELQRDLPLELDRIILRALAPNPEERYQTMAQLEYDLTKSLWGRPRAVSDLLGLRDPNRSEDSGGVRDRREGSSPPAGFDGPREAGFSGSFAVADSARVSTRGIPVPVAPPAAAGSPVVRASSPAPVGLMGPARATTPAAGAGSAPPVLAIASGPIQAAEAAPLDARRFLVTFAFLAVLAGIAVVVYRMLPWGQPRTPVTGVALPPAPGGAPRPAPSVEAQRREVRAAEFEANLERLLAGPGPLPPVNITLVQQNLAALRRQGGAAAAQRLASRAAEKVEAIARAELDASDINAGVAHYKVAISIDPGGQGAARLAQALRTHARAALVANHPADALRWARANVAIADADPDAHALLADVLLRLGKSSAALDEYDRALQTNPEDPTWRRGWLRARRRMRAGGRVSAAGATPDTSSAAPETPSEPSAPPEPAPEQDQ